MIGRSPSRSSSRKLGWTSAAGCAISRSGSSGLAERFAESRGLILVDTKFEFGWIDRELALIDEVLTPDSSRYWDAATIQSEHPVSLDKEYVREYLKGLDWDRNPPAPPLPEEQIGETYRRYRLVHDRLGVGGAIPDLRSIAYRA